MLQDEPIRMSRTANPLLTPRLTRSDARRQFRTSVIFMSVLVCALGAGIVANIMQTLGPIAN